MVNKNPFVIYRKFFLASLIVYFLSFVLGILVSRFLNFDISPNQEGFKNLFLHNSFLGIKLMVLGWISIGILNTIYLGYNGFFLGTFVFSVIKHHGVNPILTGIMPHGITEILGFILFSTIGYETLRYIDFLKIKSKREYQMEYPKSFKNSFIIIIVATLLLLLSAYIEADVSHI